MIQPWLDKYSTLLQDWVFTKQSQLMLKNQTKSKESVKIIIISEDLTFFQKAYCASFAGFVGSLVGNPADLALIRMQADVRLPEAERRNYTSVGNAFARITKE